MYLAASSHRCQEYPEYEATAEAICSATDVMAVECELEAYGEREGDD